MPWLFHAPILSCLAPLLQAGIVLKNVRTLRSCLPSRLTYSRSKQLEEFRYPGFASQAQKMVREDPERYALIASALMDGVRGPTDRQGCNRVTPEFVRFVRQMHPELQSIARTQLVNHLEEASISLANRLVDEAHDIPIDKVPTALSAHLRQAGAADRWNYRTSRAHQRAQARGCAAHV